MKANINYISEDGTLGMIEVSRNACDIYDVRTEVIGTENSVNIDRFNSPYAVVNGKGATYDIANWCLGRFEKSYELEIDAFIDAVRCAKIHRLMPMMG